MFSFLIILIVKNECLQLSTSILTCQWPYLYACVEGDSIFLAGRFELEERLIVQGHLHRLGVGLSNLRWVDAGSIEYTNFFASYI